VKILLMGNPNVGKSVVFSRLTGVDVLASNYPGTTVEFTRGSMRFHGEHAELIDVPGTYTLNPTCKAEEIAVDMLKEGDIVVNVIDSTNLERSLGLTLQLIKRKVPLVLALNMWDETKHTGVSIDEKALEDLLEVPCVPICAVTGEGIKGLVERLTDAKTSNYKFQDAQRWGPKDGVKSGRSSVPSRILLTGTTLCWRGLGMRRSGPSPPCPLRLS